MKTLLTMTLISLFSISAFGKLCIPHSLEIYTANMNKTQYCTSSGKDYYKLGILRCKKPGSTVHGFNKTYFIVAQKSDDIAEQIMLKETASTVINQIRSNVRMKKNIYFYDMTCTLPGTTQRLELINSIITKGHQ